MLFAAVDTRRQTFLRACRRAYRLSVGRLPVHLLDPFQDLDLFRTWGYVHVPRFSGNVARERAVAEQSR